MIHRLVSGQHAPGTNNTVVGTEGGVNVEKPFAVVATPNTLVYRDLNGDFEVPLVPGSAGAAASRAYMGNLLAPIWRFVETVEVVGSPVTEVNFATALDGDVDGGYVILGRYVCAVANLLRWKINGAASVGDSQRALFDGASVSANRITANSLALCNPNLGTHSFISMMPISKTGGPRHTFTEYSYLSGSDIRYRRECGLLTTPASGINITSLGCAASLAGAIGVGSIFHLGKLRV